NHHYGQTSLAWERKQWLFLPGMTPDETIIAMRTEPEKECSVIKDRYSGLHMVFIPEAQPGEEVTVHYVIEIRDKTENTKKTEDVLVSERPDATCSKYMRQSIDRLFAPESLAALPEGQKEELLAIKDAPDQSQRIRLIKNYCRYFRGTSATEEENLLFSLLKERQGACRHRAPAFIALCRYFNIPARHVASEIHSFPEYSLDNGNTWRAQDLGGAPGDLSVHVPNFQSVVCGLALTGINQWMAQFFRNMNPEKIAALARALGISSEEIIQSLQSGTALPASATSVRRIVDIIRNLWEARPDSNAFVLGSEILKSEEKPDIEQRSLLGSWFGDHSSLASAVGGLVRSDQPVDIVLQEL
ncbi:transglutaminase-like domain-containing protein, partial [Sansalvadorimonas verongulae]|uniref:transglutaminase-like domain-containing protein n=1 Tax=Sansalvadorimonas verongulae TaxID=2172824 RepID=UPI0018AD2309